MMTPRECAERIMALEDSIARLVAAMKKSEHEGSTDHLDCHDDGGNFWYDAITEAQDLLDGDD